MACSAFIHVKFCAAPDIRYWCEVGLIVADRSSERPVGAGRAKWVRSEEKKRCVDWHWGKLKLTCGNEQPHTSVLLFPDEEEIQNQSEAAGSVQLNTVAPLSWLQLIFLCCLVFGALLLWSYCATLFWLSSSLWYFQLHVSLLFNSLFIAVIFRLPQLSATGSVIHT